MPGLDGQRLTHGQPPARPGQCPARAGNDRVLPWRSPGTAGNLLPGYTARQNFELLPAAVTGLTGGPGCHNLFRHDAPPRVTAITGTRYERQRPDGQPARYPSQGQGHQDCSRNSPPGK